MFSKKNKNIQTLLLAAGWLCLSISPVRAMEKNPKIEPEATGPDLKPNLFQRITNIHRGGKYKDLRTNIEKRKTLKIYIEKAQDAFNNYVSMFGKGSKEEVVKEKSLIESDQPVPEGVTEEKYKQEPKETLVSTATPPELIERISQQPRQSVSIFPVKAIKPSVSYTFNTEKGTNNSLALALAGILEELKQGEGTLVEGKEVKPTEKSEGWVEIEPSKIHEKGYVKTSKPSKTEKKEHKEFSYGEIIVEQEEEVPSAEEGLEVKQNISDIEKGGTAHSVPYLSTTYATKKYTVTYKEAYKGGFLFIGRKPVLTELNITVRKWTNPQEPTEKSGFGIKSTLISTEKEKTNLTNSTTYNIKFNSVWGEDTKNKGTYTYNYNIGSIKKIERQINTTLPGVKLAGSVYYGGGTGYRPEKMITSVDNVYSKGIYSERLTLDFPRTKRWGFPNKTLEKKYFRKRWNVEDGYYYEEDTSKLHWKYHLNWKK